MTSSNEAADGSKHGAWTAQEDQLLGKYQEVHGNRWSLVALHIPGRTGQQCAQRWRHKVNPNIRKEKWTASEDRQLASLVAEHGNRWADIARQMPGRTDQQCMGRWRRHLDPNIRKCHWQAHEDDLLKAQYEALGPQWSNISKSLQGRTAQQCRARWFQLCPSSNVPPVPRTARNQNGRRDRHHDGASIQESARFLVAQMSSAGKSGATAATVSVEKVTSNTESQPDLKKDDASKADSVGLSQADDHATAPAACAMSARRHRNVNACVADAMTLKNAATTAVVAEGASLKERRAAARRRNLSRRHPAQHGSHGTALRRGGANELEDESSLLAWESKRQRSHSTRPRRNVDLAAIRSVSPPMAEHDDDGGDSPKGDVDRVLEAAAALTEMAGGPRVNPSASPPSVRKAAHRLLQPDASRDDDPVSLVPPKDVLCCTPAKRPAGLPLWDGGSPSKLSRRDQSGLEQTPSHARINTPLLNFGGSPGFGVSPLQMHHEPAIVMTPGSQTLLRSMAHNPIDKLDIAGDFGTPLSTPGQSFMANTTPAAEGGVQTPSVLRHDPQAPMQTATPSRGSMAMAMKPPAAPPSQRSLLFEAPGDDVGKDGTADAMPDQGGHVAECQFVSPVKGPTPPLTDAAHEAQEAPVLSAPHSTPPPSVPRPLTPLCKQGKHGAGEGPGRVAQGTCGLAVKIDQDADMPELASHSPRLGVQALESDARRDQMTANAPQDENEQTCEVNAGTASNSSTGKSSGISSLDAIERTASRRDAADLKHSEVAGAKQGEGAGCDPGGSRVIRTQLDSLLDDVFSF
eukprot:jgi/Ulvmu1/4114/UM019_0093.1